MQRQDIQQIKKYKLNTALYYRNNKTYSYKRMQYFLFVIVF